MTAPGKDTDPAPVKPPAAASAAVERLSVVTFVHHDRIFGKEQTMLAVVVAVGSQLTVLPVEKRHLTVDPAAVHLITAADLDGI